MKILLTGADGQLGKDCQAILASTHTIIGVDIDTLDITDKEMVWQYINEITPDLIINCAAYTLVDGCEKNREKAWAVNATGPANLSMAARHNNALIVHISTDYVYDGQKAIPQPYIETDPTGPLSWYGKSKIAGEESVSRYADNFLILRTAWLYGLYGNNFLKTILKNVINHPRKRLKIVNDQHGSPTWAYRLALQIKALIEAQKTGTYHASGEGHCTWFELAKLFLAEMKVPHRIEPCSTKELPTLALRPKNSILKNHNLNELDMNLMVPWQEDLMAFVRLHRDQLLKEAEALTGR